MPMTEQRAGPIPKPEGSEPPLARIRAEFDLRLVPLGLKKETSEALLSLLDRSEAPSREEVLRVLSGEEGTE